MLGEKLDKLKARIVAKGFTHGGGMDYGEKFSLTLRFESVRLMVATTRDDGLHTHQMDVTTAFLHTSLDKEVYVELMEGMKGYGTVSKVARLWKAVYGLKQASGMWNLYIDRILKEMGFSRLTADYGVYSSGTVRIGYGRHCMWTTPFSPGRIWLTSRSRRGHLGRT